MAGLDFIKNIQKYEFFCKRRGYHKPIESDESDFKKNPKFSKETYCNDCGVALELKLDEHDKTKYWIQEI